jgi:superfamily II DNA/RNA helicase
MLISLTTNKKLIKQLQLDKKESTIICDNLTVCKNKLGEAEAEYDLFIIDVDTAKNCLTNLVDFIANQNIFIKTIIFNTSGTLDGVVQKEVNYCVQYLKDQQYHAFAVDNSLLSKGLKSFHHSKNT